MKILLLILLLIPLTAGSTDKDNKVIPTQACLYSDQSVKKIVLLQQAHIAWLQGKLRDLEQKRASLLQKHYE